MLPNSSDNKKKKNYKETLLMPKTAFAMKANLSQNEPKIREKWEKIDLSNTILNNNKTNDKFILHDGPPYANGSIHLGHALNKILKDFVLRYKSMSGFYCPYVIGWDTHGLPIENMVLKQGFDRNNMDQIEFRNKCRDYALQQVATQVNQFKNLGLLTNMQRKYITLSRDYEATELSVFSEIMRKGLLYRALKPVYWSPSSESAFAESEIQYKMQETNSIYVAFQTIKTRKFLKNAKIIIWTTTPWTIPANQLLAVNKTATYILLKNSDPKYKGYYVLAKDCLGDFVSKLNWKNIDIIKEFSGNELVGVSYQNPLYQDRISKVVVGHHVRVDAQGTGIVHIASGFGEDDFIIAKNNNIPIFCPLNEKGNFTSEVKDPDLVGKFYLDVNDLIIARLKTENSLLFAGKIMHSAPIDWRTKLPIIYRATSQWFIKLDQISDELQHEAKKINWLPQWGTDRMNSMISDRSEWCISRQRLWGLPIPIFYTEKNTPILDYSLIDHVRELIAKNGSNIWWEWQATALLPENYKHPDSPNDKFSKETDIFDVWFDSGVSSLVTKSQNEEEWPADLIIEGNDQFRGWFNSSLIIGVTSPQNSSPYKTAIAHGFVVDKNGYKMSKSLQNVINPLDVCKKYGSDILRLWLSSVDYLDDIRYSENNIIQISESYRKVRNTIRFLLANLYDFNPEKNRAEFSKKVDVAIVTQLNKLVIDVTEAFEKYDFVTAYTSILNFSINELSSFYFKFIKDILYVEESNNLRRRQVQSLLYDILITLLKLIAPIIPHTAEEAYMSGDFLNKLDSIHLEKWPKKRMMTNFDQDIKLYLQLRELQSDVNVILENSRQNKVIATTSQAELYIIPNAGYEKFKNWDDLAQIFNVASVIFINKSDSDNEYTKLKTCEIKIKQTTNKKCLRCWNYAIIAPSSSEICKRCSQILETKNSNLNSK